MLPLNTYRFSKILFVMVCTLMCLNVFAQPPCAGITTSNPTLSSGSIGCSYPRAITITNNTTGLGAATTMFSYKISGTSIIFDSVLGTGSRVFNAPGPGTYIIRMIARTASGCIDSTRTATVTVSGGSPPRIYDGNGQLSFTPVFRNCILNPKADSSYQVDIQSPDSLRAYTIIWGDVSPNNSGVVLNPNAVVSHTYYGLGQYTLKIATDSAGCKDTITGIVYVLRPPNGSIVPIIGGTYVGCAPLTITYRDSSFFVTPGTILTWDFGLPGAIFTRDFSRANDTIQFTYPLTSALAACPKTISLTISNPQCGTPITNAKTGEVQVYNKSAAGITPPTPLCNANRTYTFTNSSTNNCVGGDRYFWRTADTTIGWTASKAPVTITFPGLGNQSVRLIDSNTCGVDSIEITPFINRPPVAGFTVTPKQGCQPLNGVLFTDTSLGLNITRSWNFVPGSSSAATVSRNYTTAGTFPMRLSVSNECGSSGPVRDTIRVFAKPTVRIRSGLNGCAPFTRTFLDSTINQSPAATYRWTFGNGDSSALRNPLAVTYTLPGTYLVKLIVSDTCGVDSFSTNVIVSTVPVANFTADTICRGDTTTFINTSILAFGDNIAFTKWYFGDGDSATSINTTHVYATQGTKTAVLRVQTDKGCVDFDTLNTVFVNTSPNVSINSINRICDGGSINFDGTATAGAGIITGFQWTFSNGISDTAHSEDTSYVFPTAGTYTVRYKVDNSTGCSFTQIKNITIDPIPDAIPTASNFCFQQFVQFRDSSTVAFANTIDSTQWDFNNDQVVDSISNNPMFQFPSVNTFKVKLRVVSNNGCSNTDSINITTNPLPVAGITHNGVSKCKLDTFVLGNTTTGASTFTWRFGDTNPDSVTTTLTDLKKVYSDTGLFAIRMIATTALGCKDTATVNINSRPFPVAQFSVNDTLSCAPKNFVFTNTSILANNYAWQINGLQTTTSINRADTFIATSGQSFLVSLIATNIFGCRADTAQKNVQTIANPTPVFTSSVDSGCGPLFVSFNNSSSGATSYQWSLGNGNNPVTINAVSNYIPSALNDSLYTIKLIAFNGPGCKDSISKTIRVFPKPISSYTQSQTDNCGPLSTQFINTSVHKFGGTINDINFKWNFGNGDTSIAKDPVNTFYASLIQDTIFNVSLIATTIFGCSDTSNSTVKIYPNPRSSFVVNNDNGCGPFPVNFINTSIPNDTGSIGIMTFEWDFKNGITSTSVNSNATFTANLTKDTLYNTRLIAISEHGCRDTSFKNILIYPKPQASFTLPQNNGCSPFNAVFTNTSIPFDTGDISIMSFVWNLGNGFGNITQNAFGQYTSQILADSAYSVKLFATSEHGCRDTAQQIITAHPRPIAGFNNNISAGCGPLNVQFNNTSLLAATHRWRFGDGDSSASASPLHVFQSFPLVDSIYNVSLSVLSNFGCTSDTVFGNIIARYQPVADFVPGFDSICGSGAIAFTNFSVGGISNTWNFGNGLTSTSINPVSNFTGLTTKDTIYTIRLIVNTPYSCKDTVVKQVKVNPLPNAQFTAVIPGCTPLPVSFNNVSTRAVKYDWDFGDGTTDTTQQATKTFINIVPLTTRDFQVILTATSQSGCIDTAKQLVTVYPPPIAAFSSTVFSGCGPLPVSFSNQSASNFSGSLGITYNWLLGNGVTSTLKTPSTIFQAHATKDTVYTTRLISISEFGCRDTIENDITVFPKPKAQFTTSDTVNCTPLNATFINSSFPNDTGTIDIMSFIWDYANGLNAVTKDGITEYSNLRLVDTVFKVKLIAVSEHGCRDTASQNITVHPKPTATFTQNKVSGCGPFDVTFSNTSQINNTSKWYFGDGDSSISINPIHTFQSYPLIDTTYTTFLVNQSAFGCISDTAKRIITGRYIPDASFLSSSDSTCNPGSISFFNTSIGGLSNAWNFGNGTTANNVNPTVTFSGPITTDTTYRVRLIVTSPFACMDTVFKNIKVNPLPNAAFANIGAACTPHTVLFNNTTQRGATYEWDFGDGTTDNNAVPIKTFINDIALVNKNYSVLLKAYSSSGCMDTAKRTVTVFPLPIVNYTANKSPNCDTAEFNIINSTLGATSYNWKQSLQQISTQFSPIIYFNSAPTTDSIYNLKLIATSAQGCMDSLVKPVTVRPLVKAIFTTSNTSSCANLNVLFGNNSTNALSYFWLFGDGTGSPLQAPQHKYNNTGSYNVTLIAYDAFGCTDTMVKNNGINIFEVPSANFLYSPPDAALPNATIQFTDLSFLSLGTLSHQWNFGDEASPQNTSNIKNPTHIFSDSGNYTVKLVAITANNCVDTSVQVIRIRPHPPIPEFTFNPPKGCSPLTVQFTDASQFANSYDWTFDDGQKSSLQNPEVTFKFPGKYGAFLKVEGPGGIRQIRKDEIIEVFGLPRANFFATPIKLIIPNSTVTLTDISSDAVSCKWRLIQDGVEYFTDTNQNSSYTFNTEGKFDVMLIAYSQNGCADTLEKPQLIDVINGGKKFIGNAFTPNGDGINDVFKPTLQGVLSTDYLFEIYNRWGQRVFVTNNTLEGWDGTFAGAPATIDDYVWILNGKFVGNISFTEKGTVTLLR